MKDKSLKRCRPDERDESSNLSFSYDYIVFF